MSPEIISICPPYAYALTLYWEEFIPRNTPAIVRMKESANCRDRRCPQPPNLSQIQGCGWTPHLWNE